MQSKILALTALAAAPILAHKPVVNVYFGQTGTDSLGSYCESNAFEYVTIGFVNNSPEQDKSGLDYPGTNFAAHCAADVYTKNGKKSQLLSQCTFIADDIPKCQAAGKKVLLSVGGVFNQKSNYTVSSAAKGVKFADFLWGSFGPYNPLYNGPRPFDFNGKHVAVDGFDFDIETKFADQSGYIAMIARLRQKFALGDYLITGAPQCPLSDQYFQMKEMITKAKFDILWIQFYNNPGCDAVPNNDLTGPGEHFNYDEWETFLAGTQSKNAKLFIGILGAPADPPSPQSGYLEPEDAVALFEEYKTRPSFGGAMIWDVNTGGQVLPDGKTYIETIHDVVCGPPEVITTTTEPAPTSTVYPTTEETYPSTTADVTTSDSYPSETETATETAYPSQPTEAYPTSTEAETSDSYPSETATGTAYPSQPTEAYPTSTEGETSDSYPTATGTDYPSQPTDTYPTSTEDSDAYPTTTIDDSVPTDAYPSASDTDVCDDDEYPTETGTEGSYPTETGTEGPYPTGTEGTYPTATETSEAYPTETETCTDETETAVPTSDVYPTGTEGSYPTGTSASDAYPTSSETCTESEGSYPTGTEGSYPTGTEGSYPTGTSASEAYPASSETCTESDVYPTSAASETAPVEGYPVTKEVIATVVPAPSGYEVVTPSGVGNFEVYPTQAFSTVTVAKYPTGGVVPSASYANSAPAAAGTEYPNGNATPTYPGYATSASAAVEVTAPVTAGAGRNAVAFGVPAAMAVAMLVL